MKITIKKFFGISAVVFIMAVIFAYQNCSGAGSGIKIGSTGAVTIEVSNSGSFTPTTNFNYNETVYQRAKNFGADAIACAEIVGQSDGFCANNMAPLSTADGWTYNAASGDWIAVEPASTFHGRTIKGFIKRVSDGAAISYTFSVQSVADSNTTDVIAFHSTDAAGKNVIMDVKNSTTSTFYSHVKNVTTADYVCIYVVTNANGSPGTNPCGSTVPPANSWEQLPADTASDGNTTMLSYSNVSSDFHTTQIQHYVYKGGQKYGPFYFDIHP